MRLPFESPFLSKHRKYYLAAVFIFFAVFAFLFSRIRFHEDISEMIPLSLQEELQLFRNSPLADKIFIVVKSPSAQETRKAADTVSSALMEDADLGLSFSGTDEDFILSYYYCAPKLWNAVFAEKAEALTAPEALKIKMEENYKNLLSPAGIFLKDFIMADPIGLIPVFAQELAMLNPGTSLEAENGYLSSPDGKEILLIFNYSDNSLDSAHAKKISAVFGSIKRELPSGIEAFMMGSVRYTNENNAIIAKDIKNILLISSFFMTVIFIVLLRSKKAILIYLVPPAVMSFAAVVTSFLFNGISGITIGFGSVLMGLSIDYCVYMYFAIKASPEQQRYANAKKMVKPIAISALTSIATFSLLYFSVIPLFKQISVFSVAGLCAALFLALFAAPFIFESGGGAEKTLKKTEPALSFFSSVLIVVLIFAAAAISLKFVRFNPSLDSVNTVSRQFEKDRLEFERLTGSAYNNNAFLFVFGDSADEALRNNEILSGKNENVLKLAKLYPSKSAQKKNLAAWKAFWDAAKIEKIEEEIEKFSKSKGLKPEIFSAFYEFLRTGEAPYGQEVSLKDVYNPVIKHDGGFAFVNIVAQNAEITGSEGIRTLLVSNDKLQQKISSSISGNIMILMCVLAAGTFLVLSFWLKKVQFALAAMLPTLCGICMFVIVSAVSGTEINIFGLFAAPLLIGLGIDYGIFMIYQQKGEAQLHPTKAVMVAALSTLIGFGALMAAQHKVLFMIGFMVFTGILTAIAASIFILPPMLKKINKSLLLLLACFLLPLSGCATGSIKYNVKEPEVLQDSAMTAVFYGSYEDDFHFRVISRTEDDGYRIVIMNDLGVKLQDMKIKKEDNTEIYFHIQYMPKEVVEDFAEFFSEYYFDEEKKHIIEDSSGIYYLRRNKAVLWVKKI